MKLFDKNIVVLNLARDILKGAFAKGTWAKDKNGMRVYRKGNHFDAANAPNACAWCYEGAVMKACGDLGYDADKATAVINACDASYVAAYRAAYKRLPEYSDLMSINDDGGKKAVLDAMGRAIGYLQKQFKQEQKAERC